jgi:hypothetical protein
MKHLLTKLSGDHTWIPCDSVETEDDFLLFGDERDHQQGSQFQKTISKDDGDQLSTETLVSDDVAQAALLTITQSEAPQDTASDVGKGDSEVPAGDGDDTMLSATDEGANVNKHGTSEPPASGEADEAQQHHPKQSTEFMSGERQEEVSMGVEIAMQPDEKSENQVLVTHDRESEAGEDGPELPAPTRMRTRAQAQAASDNATIRTRSTTPDSNMDSFIHPYFLAPLKSHPDRDLGLPQHEAEETRRLLQLYIQKQEEVCRGAQRVYEGLLRADRYRHLVMKWAKAEAHVGLNRDMSDGEDWYDKDEWGLDEDLKKGQDEDEEDAATTAKKTRNRRQ